MKLQNRTVKGSRLNKLKIVPGVFYGSGIESMSIQADASEFAKAYSKYGTSKTFEVTLGKEKHVVYLKEVVPEYLKQKEYNHFDLIKVAKDDKLTNKVRLIWLNKETVEKRGFIINGIIDDVEIEYTVGSGIGHLDINVEGLKENDTLYVKDIYPVEGVKILLDPDTAVLSISRPKEEVVEETEDQGFTEVESIKQKSE